MLAFFLFLTAIHEVYAGSHQYNFLHYTIENGLSDNRVQAIIQDEKGFIWVGTNDGLNRFDGREFLIFRKEAGKHQGLPGNNVACLLNDSNGFLWAGTVDGGLCMVNTATLEITAYPNSKGYNHIRRMASDQRGYLWVSFDNGGIWLFDKQKKIWSPLPVSDSDLTWKAAYSLLCRSNGEMIFSFISLGLLTHHENEVVGLMKKENKFPYAGHTLSDLYEDESGVIWAGAWDNALHRFDLKSGAHDYFLFDGNAELRYSGNEIVSLEAIDGNVFWLGTKSGGVIAFDKRTGKFTPVTSDHEWQGQFKGKHAGCMYRAADGNIWIGTEEGLHVYNPFHNQFDIYFLQRKNKVNTFLRTGPDRLLVGTDGGIATTDTGSFIPAEYPVIMNGQRMQCRRLFRTKAGEVFIGTNKSLYLLNPVTFSLEKLNRFNIKSFLSFNDVESSYVSTISNIQMDEGEIIAAFFYGHGLAIFNPYTLEGSFCYVATGALYENLVKKIYFDHAKRSWILGANKGLQRVLPGQSMDYLRKELDAGHPIDLKTKSYVGQPLPDGLPCSDVNDMTGNPDGTAWITTNGCGLYFKDASDHFSEIPGIINSLQGVTTDLKGNVWMITSKGILCYQPDVKQFRLYGRNSGIPLEGLGGYWYEDEKNRLYAGGNGFFISFDPNTILKNDKKPVVRFSHLLVGEEPADSLLGRSEVRLNYRQNFIAIQYTTLDFTDPSKEIFRYKLEGVDRDWKTTTNHVINYTNLAPGNYFFQISACNNDGLWGTEVSGIKLIILPPWYATWWFYGLIAAVVIACAYGVYRYRIRQILKLQEVRNRIARDLHDDMGSTLGSISIFTHVVDQFISDRDLVAAKDIVSKIGDTSRKMMEGMHDTVWAVNPQNDSLDHLTIRMKEFAIPILQAAGMSWSMDADPAVLNWKLSMEKRKNIFLIFKETIHNAIKYANSPSFLITLRKKGNRIVFVIRDEGIGFSTGAASSYNGNGLKNIRTRAADMKAVCNIESVTGKGTTITLEVEPDHQNW